MAEEDLSVPSSTLIPFLEAQQLIIFQVSLIGVCVN